MENKRIVFLGTPAIASTILEGLIEANYNVVAVVTQPDKEVGRKRILTPSPVKEVALKYNLPVFQPVKIRNDYQFLVDLKPDMIITTAYGQILPQAILDIATINNINVHGSLLPQYRGGAPIQRAIMNGDKVTGITIMEMIDRMDAGKMYAKKEIEISENMNSTELFEKMAQVGKELLLSVLDDLLENKIEGEVQDENLVTIAPTIKKEEEKIEFDNEALKVHNHIRGLATNPGAFCMLDDKKMKIYATRLTTMNDNNEVGTLKIENKHLYVKCKDAYLEILTLQMEGKNVMNAKDFLNGFSKGGVLK